MQHSQQDLKFKQLTENPDHSHRIYYLYHLTHIENLPGILRDGILSHKIVQKSYPSFMDISESNVQYKRGRLKLESSSGRMRLIHEMVPLFLRPITPMLCLRQNIAEDLCFILINSSYVVRDDIECIICDGNIAVHQRTRTYNSFGNEGQNLDKLPWEVLNAVRWSDFPDGARKRGAEFLIWPSIDPSGFWKILVKSKSAYDRVCTHLQVAQSLLKCEVVPRKFF